MLKFISYASCILLVLLISFATGFVTAQYQTFPYFEIRKLYRAVEALARLDSSRHAVGFLDYENKLILTSPGSRFHALNTDVDQDILLPGGVGEFLDICPAPGCLAVVFDGKGKVKRKYPLRLEQILSAPGTGDRKYEIVPADPSQYFGIYSLQAYDNGDLLASFNFKDAFPWGGGLARIRPDGEVVWRRRDYSHHWAKLLADGIAVIPGHNLLNRSQHKGPSSRHFPECDFVEYEDTVNVIDGNGTLIKSQSVIDLFGESPRFRDLLFATVDPCDPLHLNFIDVANKEIAKEIEWLEPGDYLVSLRNLSTLAVLDHTSFRIKRLIKGSFVLQHSAQFLGKDSVILFDNIGASWNSSPSRVLTVNLKTGQEKVITVPQEAKSSELFSLISGNINISPDGSRALVAYTEMGKLVEVDLRTKELRLRYENIHPVPESESEKGSARFARYILRGAWYYRIPGESHPPSS